MELIDQVTINDLSKRDLLLIIKSLEFTGKKTKNKDRRGISHKNPFRSSGWLFPYCLFVLCGADRCWVFILDPYGMECNWPLCY